MPPVLDVKDYFALPWLYKAELQIPFNQLMLNCENLGFLSLDIQRYYKFVFSASYCLEDQAGTCDIQDPLSMAEMCQTNISTKIY
jgi:hypothetical protein